MPSCSIINGNRLQLNSWLEKLKIAPVTKKIGGLEIGHPECDTLVFFFLPPSEWLWNPYSLLYNG
jgi:hypothetical protein